MGCSSPTGTGAHPSPTATIARIGRANLSGPVYELAADAPAAQPAPGDRPVAPGSSRLLRNVLALSGGQLASWVFSVAWVLVVPNKLGPAAIGEFVIAVSTAAVFGVIINQGAGPLLTREIARDHSRAPRLIAGTIVMRLAIALPTAAAMFAYIHWAGFEADRGLLIWLACGVVLMNAVSGAFNSAFAGVERMEYIAYTGLVANSLFSLLAVTLVLLGGHVLEVMELDLALAVLALGLNILWSKRLFTTAWRGAVRTAAYLARAGFSFWIGGLFFVAYLWIDSILLSLLVPAKVVGWYGLPTQIFASLLAIASVPCTAWFPRLAAAHHEGTEALRSSARPAVEAIVVLSLPIAAGSVIVAGPLMTTLYGGAFDGAAPVLAVLGLCLIPTYFNMMAYQILQAQGRQLTWFWVVGIATVLNVAANLVLIPRFEALGNGAIGAALSLLGTELFEFAAAIYLLPWLFGPGLMGRVGRAAGATALMIVATLAATRLGLVAEVAVGMVTFGLFSYLLKVPTAGEMAALRGLSVRFRRKLGLATASGL